jgi:hypothetical protein
MASSKQIIKRIRDSLYAGQKRLSSMAATTAHGSDDGEQQQQDNEKDQ